MRPNAMREYKGYKYFKNESGLWTVILDRDSLFIVALDDSKAHGNRKIVWNNNNEDTCKRFIDIITKKI